MRRHGLWGPVDLLETVEAEWLPALGEPRLRVAPPANRAGVYEDVELRAGELRILVFREVKWYQAHFGSARGAAEWFDSGPVLRLLGRPEPALTSEDAVAVFARLADLLRTDIEALIAAFSGDAYPATSARLRALQAGAG